MANNTEDNTSADDRDENIWEQTTYQCKDCGGDDVLRQVTDNWKLYYCNDCGSQMPLKINDMIEEAYK